MLRDHEVLNHPLVAQQKLTESIETPSAWKAKLKGDHVKVLPIVTDKDATYRDGWCVYTYEHKQAPELEIICGGINTKTPKASAIWRQGFILHFGFEPTPSQFNENGRAILVNSICYISRFGEDRPLVRTPSAFYSRVRKTDRGAIDRLVRNSNRDLDQYLTYYLSGETQGAVKGMSRDEVGKWYEENREFLFYDERGKFTIDQQAREFGSGFDSAATIESAIDCLAMNDARSQLARILLVRYVPEGPGTDAQKETWKEWWTTNREYVFFTDTGGCCWLVDHLARRRSVPTKDLRGIERATRKPVRLPGRPDAV